ncbi:MAG: outer membrane beta-barrel domain-containing protein [Bradymonadales bacterium]|nr:MAG: outer membrane beta-barrel domain-containing protein [Bradymonadales bacterium]
MASISSFRSVLLGFLIFVSLPFGASFSQDSIRDQLRLFDREDIHSIHKRLFTKVGRHEIGVQAGGIFNNNGFALALASYQYHFYESLGVELSGGYAFQFGDTDKMMLGQGSVIFSPIYGKVSWFTWAVLNFDLYTVAGLGAVRYDSQPSGTGFMANVGLGTRLFINDFLSARIEFRDYVYNRSFGDRTKITHNFALTAGLSVLIPFRQSL